MMVLILDLHSLQIQSIILIYLLFSGSVTVSEVIEGNSAIDRNGVTNNEITTSEFTIENGKAAKYLLIETDDIKVVDISAPTTISDIIDKIKV